MTITSEGQGEQIRGVELSMINTLLTLFSSSCRSSNNTVCLTSLGIRSSGHDVNNISAICLQAS